jgi:hypothetical protein
MIVSDNGTELTSNAVLAWCGEEGITWRYLRPMQPNSKSNRLLRNGAMLSA